MKATIFLVAAFLPLVFLNAGCYTSVAVNFGNGTAKNIRVQSSQSGEAVEVAPKKFKKVPHSHGDLIVTTWPQQKFKFERVAPFDVDRKYQTIRRSLLGPNSVSINVWLGTNMQLYVLMPGTDASQNRSEQPSGYPRASQEIRN